MSIQNVAQTVNNWLAGLMGRLCAGDGPEIPPPMYILAAQGLDYDACALYRKYGWRQL